MADVELTTLGTVLRDTLNGVSGLDADTLGGQSSAAFATAAALALKLTTTALATGAITPRADDLNFGGGADGQVWTVQADGSVAFETVPSTGGGIASMAEDTTPELGGTLDGNANAIVDYTQPHVAGVSGTLNQAAHGGRPVHITGTITTINATGFVCEIRNKSGAARTVNKPASGDLIHEGIRKASISLPDLRSVIVAGDGTDVWVYRALA